jgi:hypothetical protein
MPGARCTRSLVCAIGNKYAHEYSQRATGKHPTFPHAMVYGLYRALPGDRLSCHRHRADMWLVRPVGLAKPPRDLTPASRRQDHTTSPSASAPFVSLPPIAHGPKPALPSRVMPDAAASTASRPNVRDDGQRPSAGQDRGSYRVICDFGKAEYFFRQGLTRRLQNSLTGKSVEWCADTMAVGRIGAEGVIRRFACTNATFRPRCSTISVHRTPR